MKIGLGLPVDDSHNLIGWARRADLGRFSTLAVLDRLVYDNPEPLITLAVLAGVTSRVRLQTEVLLAPLRGTALLAKQAATLDQLSAGRLTLGIGVGGRKDDHIAAGVNLAGRGRRLDEQMTTLRRLWAGATYSADAGPIGPAPARPGGPEVLFGAFAPAALDRVARFGDGFVCAAAPSWAGGLFRTVERAWDEAGRMGRPRHVGQVNVALGPPAVLDAARSALRSYYDFLEQPDRAADGLLTTPTTIRGAITAFGDLGADEVILYCWAGDPDQVDRLADAVA